MWDQLFSAADSLQQGLEASWLRNSVIRNNIANVETPGFKSSDVEFESIFASAVSSAGTESGLKTTRDKHISSGVSSPDSVTAQVVETGDSSLREDGNNVDIENENVKLAQNSIQYNTLMTKLNSELSRIKMAINEGK